MEGRDPGRYIGHMLILLLMFAITPAELRANDGVATVREALPAAETCIIHIRDWHLVPKDAFAADTELEGKELDEAYAEHIRAVKAVQASQRTILKDTKEVYSEGLAKSDMPVFEAMIRLMRKKPEEDRLMRMGVVAQLRMQDKLMVLPAENEFFEKANPLKDGKVEIDHEEQERREDAIVRNLLKQQGTVYLVLGGAHDLSDNIKRLSKDCGYFVVTPKGWPE
jgi:hypothetical protein